MVSIEAVLLTGGASRRMGTDKSLLEVAGKPLAERIAKELSAKNLAVTVLGREPIEGFGFLPDSVDYAGPLEALSRFGPSAELIAVLACDLPRLDGSVIMKFADELDEEVDAIVPVVNGKRQPLCSIYRHRAWGRMPAEGKRSMMAWLDQLQVRELDEDRLLAIGIDPQTLRGFNTPEEFRELSEF